MYHGAIDGRHNQRLTGDVRLENDGGFIQAALDLAPRGDTIDAFGFTGMRVVVRGKGEKYSVNVRTLDNLQPWHSYPDNFTIESDLEAVDFRFETLCTLPGWKHPWTRRGSVTSAWLVSGVLSLPTSRFVTLLSISRFC
jgi:hypothetical protein